MGWTKGCWILSAACYCRKNGNLKVTSNTECKDSFSTPQPGNIHAGSCILDPAENGNFFSLINSYSFDRAL